MNEKAPFPGEGKPAANRTLIGEPVTKPDGTVVTFYKTSEGVLLDLNGITVGYSDQHVELVGHGNWGYGVIRLSQAAYNDDVRWGDSRPLNDEIRFFDPYEQ